MSNIIEVRTPTSYGARSAAIAIIDGFGGRDCVKSVILNTKQEAPDLLDSSEDWPVRLKCVSELEGLYEFEIRICMLASGYNGTGPHDLESLLDYAGFDFDKREIYQRLFNEEWKKEE